MRILHILNDLSNRGNGIVNVTVDLSTEQVKLGDVVAVVAGGGEYVDLVKQLGVKYYELDQSRRGLNVLSAIIGLRRIFRDFQPDIIHAHMRTGLVLAWICSRSPRRPLIGHLHNVHDAESRIMRIADLVIAVSRSVKETMSPYIPAAKIHVVLNGPLKSPRSTALSSLKPKALHRPSITTVAGMSHRKGIAELLEAFELIAPVFTDAHLYLVGEGPERVLFEGKVANSSFRQRIHFEGVQSNPQAYMLSTDVFVLASRRDSLALVIAEARETGCAIIATAVDGIPEALDEGEAGVLIPARDPNALATEIGKLLRSDELRRSWQLKALRNCDFYVCHRMAVDMREEYVNLIAARKER